MPRIERETATLASPPPKLASRSGRLEEALAPGRLEPEHELAEGDDLLHMHLRAHSSTRGGACNIVF